jgi:hypothetical protein
MAATSPLDLTPLGRIAKAKLLTEVAISKDSKVPSRCLEAKI